MSAEMLEPGVRRVLAPNPSPLTERGTNTYLLGQGEVAVVDPGPANADHLEAILTSLEPGERITAILVTHPHLDHSALVPALKAATDAPVYAFGGARDGRSAVMDYLEGAGELGGGEGLDTDFQPDIRLDHHEELVVGDEVVTALWTPGHIGSHLAFGWRDTVFSGDVVMGWATTLVSPPEGDLTAFMDSVAKLGARDARRFFPGHGATIDAPAERCTWLLEHRRQREMQILQALQAGPGTVAQLTETVYTDVPAHLHPAAQRNVLAHLIDLTTGNRAMADGKLGMKATYRLP